MARMTVAQAATRVAKFAREYDKIVVATLRLELDEVIQLARRKYFRRGGRRGPRHIVSRSGQMMDSMKASVKTTGKTIVGTIQIDRPYVHDGSKRHVIRAKRGRWLRWEDDSGDVHFAKKVNHPGTKPRPVILWAGNERRPQTTKAISRAVRAEWHRKLGAA